MSIVTAYGADYAIQEQDPCVHHAEVSYTSTNSRKHYATTSFPRLMGEGEQLFPFSS